MIANQKICVVLPAYNAGRTLETTYREIARDVVDDVILVDDASTDDTLAVAKKLGIYAVAHARNKGGKRKPGERPRASRISRAKVRPYVIAAPVSAYRRSGLQPKPALRSGPAGARNRRSCLG